MNGTTLTLIFIAAKMFAFVPVIILILMLPNAKQWWRFFTKGPDFKNTKVLLWMPGSALVTIPFLLFLSIFFIPSFVVIPYLEFMGNVSTHLVMICCSTSLWLLLVGFRRSVRIAAGPSVIIFSRVTREKFEVHLRRKFVLCRIFSSDTSDLTIKDFYKAFSTAITENIIADIRSAGGTQMVLASIWLHRQSRIRVLRKFLQTMTPVETNLQQVTVKLGRMENVCVRLFQILLLFIDKNRNVFKCSTFKVWVTFAKLSKPFKLTRIKMNGLLVQL